MNKASDPAKSDLQNHRIIIAIDGYSSCGKSTLAKTLARKIGYVHVDSGAMYRAVTLYLLEHDVPIDDLPAVKVALAGIHIKFKNENGLNRTFLNGQDVEKEIRSMRVSQYVSQVAAISAVRRALVAQQRRMGQNKGIVMDGRDIGTVVFPDAELKIFLTAGFEVRAARRYQELRAKGLDIDMESVRHNLSERDRIDSTRKDSPLLQADDAIVIDNSEMDIQEMVGVALSLVTAHT